MRYLGVLFGMLILALSAGSTARAAEKIDHEQVRVITPDEATSTCIGNPINPVCALDTFLACHARSDISLCKRIGLIPDWKLPPPHTIKYKILIIIPFGDASIPKEYKDSHWSKPAYFLVMFRDSDLRVDNCEGDNCFGLRAIVHFRPFDEHWHYFDWVEMEGD